MAGVRKKQDDKNLKILRELVTSGGNGGNRQCFDCGQKGPTYVNMTIGSFVCTRCSGVLRGLTPPHRVKSISMATFSPEEIEFLKSHGNDACTKTWLGLWDPKRIVHQDQRELMIDKYERKRYYLEPASPLKSLTNSNVPKSMAINTSNTVTSNTTLNGNSVTGSNSSINVMNGNSSSSSNGSISNLSSNSTSSISKQINENNIKNIILAPPSSLHLNGINGHSRSNRHNNYQSQFTPDENGFFDSTSNKLSNGNSNSSNNNNLIGNINGSNSRPSQLANGDLTTITNQLNNCQITNKNSLNMIAPSSLETANGGLNFGNKFTPDSDFIADFGSASIFNVSNGTATMNGGDSSSSSSSSQKMQIALNGGLNGLNGFQKVHLNGGLKQINANNFINGVDKKTNLAIARESLTNGGLKTPDHSNANANFADFDHASIYNAAVYSTDIFNNALYAINNGYSNYNMNNGYTSDLFGNNNNNTVFYNADLYNNSINNAINYSNFNNNNNSNYTVQSTNTNIFLDDINERNFNATIANSIDSTSATNSSNAGNTNYNNGSSQQQHQWNIWQQFQSPLSTPSPEQNRWSLPLSLNSTSNSLSSSATFTSNSSINSTPPADRYAALKDLDDQLRENKTSLSYNSPAPTAAATVAATASPNPFKQSSPISVAGTTQMHSSANPFQTSLNPPPPATPPVTTNVFLANQSSSPFGAAMVSPPFNGTQSSPLAYGNGYASVPTATPAACTNGGVLNNGCGGIAYASQQHQQQQVAAGGNAAFGNMKNPFATVNPMNSSNNPFL